MPWYAGTAMGAFCLAIVNYWCKSHPQINLRNQLAVLLPLVLCNLGFWYGFANSANFLRAYFTGSAMSLLTGFGLSLFIFDKSISLWSVGGVCLIILGQQLLGR